MPLVVAEEYVENFGPLSLTRATFELKYGALSALERALRTTPDVVLRAREELAPYLRAKYNLPVNEDAGGETAPGLPFATPWEVLANNAASIARDFETLTVGESNNLDTGVMNKVSIVGHGRDIFLSAGATVQEGCVLDASNGPIYIDSSTQVRWSHIQGPVHIGRGCTVDGARLRPGTTLGPNCKVGGEISATIFDSRVNKAHDGFVGNSWAGRWVNFGAGATTSNLKNSYGTIRFPRTLHSTVETGVTFLGSLIGDHTKIGILQGLTTGSNIGPGCNVFGGGVAPKYLPSFCWGGQAGWSEYRLDDMVNTVRAVLARRQCLLRPESEGLLRALFPATAGERREFCNDQTHGAAPKGSS